MIYYKQIYIGKNTVIKQGEIKMVMNLQDIIAELDNIIEQASSDDEIGKEAVVEALQDVVRDAKGSNDMDMMFDDEDHYGSFEETDFSSLADLDH